MIDKRSRKGGRGKHKERREERKGGEIKYESKNRGNKKKTRRKKSQGKMDKGRERQEEVEGMWGEMKDMKRIQEKRGGEGRWKEIKGGSAAHPYCMMTWPQYTHTHTHTHTHTADWTTSWSHFNMTTFCSAFFIIFFFFFFFFFLFFSTFITLISSCVTLIRFISHVEKSVMRLLNSAQLCVFMSDMNYRNGYRVKSNRSVLRGKTKWAVSCCCAGLQINVEQ